MTTQTVRKVRIWDRDFPMGFHTRPEHVNRHVVPPPKGQSYTRPGVTNDDEAVMLQAVYEYVRQAGRLLLADAKWLIEAKAQTLASGYSRSLGLYVDQQTYTHEVVAISHGGHQYRWPVVLLD